MASETPSSSTWITIRWQALWQLWAGIAIYLYAWRQFIGRLPTTWTEVGWVVLILTISSLLVALLALLLKPEPLAIRLDYQAARATCYRPELPWRISLPLGQVRCQLSEQANHKGKSRFLLVSGPQGLAWTIQESSGWPLARLELLHEKLAFGMQ